jgi:hypothetical protein
MSEKKEQRRDEALVERLLRRVFEGMGSAVDRKLGREPAAQAGFTTTKLVERMKGLIDERARRGGGGRLIAPHHLKLKIEWGTHSEAPPEFIRELEHEVLAAAIDHINDQRYRTLAPVKVETVADIFTSGITVDPTFGEQAEGGERRAAQAGAGGGAGQTPAPDAPDVRVAARVTAPDLTFEVGLAFKPGGRRVNVGRVAGNALPLGHASVSKIHAALVMNREGTLLVSDTGSTNGTYINGRRISYGEARQIEDGDVVSFGDVEVRFKRRDG